MGFLWCFSYAQLQASETTNHTLLASIDDGYNNFAFLNGDDCVGSFATVLQTGDNSLIKGEGVLRTSYRDVRADAKFMTTAYFNPLNQLVDAQLSVQSPVTKVQIHITGAAPLQVDFNATIGKQTFSQRFELPGPLTLANIEGDHFALQYKSRNTNSIPMPSMLFDSLDSSVDFTWEHSNQAPAHCSNVNGGVLNLQPLVTLVNLKFKSFEKFFEI